MNINNNSNLKLSKTVAVGAVNLTVKQAVEVSGICERSIRQACYDRELEHLRIGRRLLIPQKSLDEYLARFVVPVVDAKAIAKEMLS